MDEQKKAPVMWAKCGDCKHLLGAGCCAVWLHRVVSATTDATQCRTFEQRKAIR